MHQAFEAVLQHVFTANLGALRVALTYLDITIWPLDRELEAFWGAINKKLPIDPIIHEFLIQQLQPVSMISRGRVIGFLRAQIPSFFEKLGNVEVFNFIDLCDSMAAFSTIIKVLKKQNQGLSRRHQHQLLWHIYITYPPGEGDRLDLERQFVLKELMQSGLIRCEFTALFDEFEPLDKGLDFRAFRIEELQKMDKR